MTADHWSVLLVVEQLRRRVPAGIGTYARGLIGGLTELQFEDAEGPAVELLASRPSTSPDPLAAYGLPVRASVLPGRLLTRLWDRGWRAPLSSVTHATLFAYPAVRGRLVVTVHDLAFRETPDAFPRRGREWHERRLLHAIANADRLVAPSRRTADALTATGLPGSRIEVIPEGSDHLPPADLDRADALLAELGASPGFILTVSTLEPRKNLRRLFAAYERLRDQRPGMPPMVVVGAEGWGEQVREVPDGVLAAGAPDDATLAGLYARAGLFVYVPLVEGFGLPPVEAMRAGLPVVASTTVPSVGDAALTVDPADVEAISNAMQTLLANRQAADEHREHGRQHVAHLTWTRAAAAHVDLWRALT
ncbi:MAG: glycosyltransferase family 4 protein [Acidimicrobiales bacterium]